MPTSDIYTGSASVTLNTATQTPLVALVTGATKRAFVTGVRVSIGTPVVSGTTALFQLFRVTNAASIVGTTAAGAANDGAAPASLAIFQFNNGPWTTAPTGTTACLWQQQVPQTAGSSWEEFPPLGYEYVIGITGGLALWVTGAAVSTPYNVELVWSE